MHQYCDCSCLTLDELNNSPMPLLLILSIFFNFLFFNKLNDNAKEIFNIFKYANLMHCSRSDVIKHLNPVFNAADFEHAFAL